MIAYCEVALPVPLDRAFTYAVREEQRPLRGARVIVPFRNEKLIGVVTALRTSAPENFEVRFLEAVLDDQPLLSDSLLKLAEWMAQYYLAPLGEVLRGMLPLMAEVRRTVYYRISDLGRDVLAASIEEGTVDSRIPESRHDAPMLGFMKLSSSKRKGKQIGKCSAEEQDLERRVLARLASGEAVKVYATHGDCGNASRAGGFDAQEVDCPRNGGGRARRSADGALCSADSRCPAACLDRKAAGDSGRVGGLRW